MQRSKYQTVNHLFDKGLVIYINQLQIFQTPKVLIRIIKTANLVKWKTIIYNERMKQNRNKENTPLVEKLFYLIVNISLIFASFISTFILRDIFVI